MLKSAPALAAATADALAAAVGAAVVRLCGVPSRHGLLIQSYRTPCAATMAHQEEESCKYCLGPVDEEEGARRGRGYDGIGACLPLHAKCDDVDRTEMTFF